MQIGETTYLDYQASTPVDERVLDEMIHASRALFANPHAADHVLGWKAASAIEAAAQQVGNLFGLQGDDVIFTSGASEANAMVFRTAQIIALSSGRQQLIVGAADHGSSINEAYTSGQEVKEIGLNEQGAPDPENLRELLNEETVLVSFVGVNNENGAITDLGKIVELCRNAGVLVHADLSQAPVTMDINLLDIDLDLATISGHKLYGPKGVGALLVGPGVADALKPVIVGAGQQGGLRGGTMPTELIVGLGEACNILSAEGQMEREEIRILRDMFVQVLEQRGIAELVGSLENRHVGNALMRFPGQDASDLLSKLQPSIAASSQSACSSGSIEPSRVIRAMGYSDDFASECIRFSLGRFSRTSQIESALRLLEATVLEAAD